MALKVDKSDIRIDSYLKDNMEFSRSKIQKLIKQGKILLNGKSVNSSALVHIGDIIDIYDHYRQQCEHIRKQSRETVYIMPDEYPLHEHWELYQESHYRRYESELAEIYHHQHDKDI